MNQTIMGARETAHPRCHKCKRRLTVARICLTCNPSATPRNPVDWRWLFCGAVLVACVALAVSMCRSQPQELPTVEIHAEATP